MDEPKREDQEERGSAIYAVWYDDSIEYFMEDSDSSGAISFILGYASGRREDIRTLYSVNIPEAYLRLEKLEVNRVTPERAGRARGLEENVREDTTGLDELERKLEN